MALDSAAVGVVAALVVELLQKARAAVVGVAMGVAVASWPWCRSNGGGFDDGGVGGPEAVF